MARADRKAEQICLKIVWTLTASRDRREQLEYVSEENPSAAYRLAGEIKNHVAHLANHPYMGRSGRKPGTRELVITHTPYIAIYRVKADTVQIVRLLHGAQNGS
jgi:toxin ParE1/3/4